MLQLVAYLLLHPKCCDVAVDDDADDGDLTSDRRSDLVSDGDDSGAVSEKSRMTIGDHCYVYEKDIYIFIHSWKKFIYNMMFIVFCYFFVTCDGYVFDVKVELSQRMT